VKLFFKAKELIIGSCKPDLRLSCLIERGPGRAVPFTKVPCSAARLHTTTVESFEISLLEGFALVRTRGDDYGPYSGSERHRGQSGRRHEAAGW
jgi:hypothetical protein